MLLRRPGVAPNGTSLSPTGWTKPDEVVRVGDGVSENWQVGAMLDHGPSGANPHPSESIRLRACDEGLTTSARPNTQALGA